MRKEFIKPLAGALGLAMAAIVSLQTAGARQSDDSDQSADSQAVAQPVPVARSAIRHALRPRPTVAMQAVRSTTTVALPVVQSNWSREPIPLPIPAYLAKPEPAAARRPLAADGADVYAGPYANSSGTERPVSAGNSLLERRLQALADGSRGRIGVAALDLDSGRSVAVLGDQPFPLASTAKVAIVATFLADVDAGRLHLGDRYPMMMPIPSAKLSSAVAPARAGEWMSAQELIERAMTLSDNHATDGLLAAIGGPRAVDRWLHGAGMTGMRIDHNINTLVRDDGLINPATTVDVHDSTTPLTMVRLLAGLYQGNLLSPSSREVLMGAMSRCRTGIHRMRLLLPSEALIGHKTGTLANTSSDVGIIRNPAGHTIALAIYVTGQGSKPDRESRIATIARAVYESFEPDLGFAGSLPTH